MSTAVGRQYDLFDLAIESAGPGRFDVKVIDSAHGQAAEQITFDTTDQKFTSLSADMESAVLVQRYDHGQHLPELERAEALGTLLFRSFFTDSVAQAYAKSMKAAEINEHGLRLQLRLRDPTTQAIPWEFLFDPATDQFLALTNDVSITRFPERSGLPRPMPVEGTIRILGVAVSSPYDGPIAIEDEIDLVERSLGRLKQRDRVVIEWLRDPTWRQIDEKLRSGPWHVFHYIGHAEAGLITVDDGGGAEPSQITAAEMAALLNSQPSLRLVVLNGCRTTAVAAAATADVPTVLAGAAISGVVTMQYQVDDSAAMELARNLYTVLAEGATLDEAVSVGRRAMQTAVESTLQWVVPMVHTRALDGRLYIKPDDATVAPLAASAKSLFRQRRWSDAVQVYRELTGIDGQSPVWPSWQSLVELEFTSDTGAIDHLRQLAPDLDAKLVANPDDLELITLRGLVHAKLKQHSSAVVDLDRVISVGSAGLAEYLARAECHRASGNTNLALADLGRAIALDNGYARPRALRAELLALAGRHTEALDDLDAALQLNPADTAARLLRARVHKRLDRRAPAIADLDVVLDAHRTAALLAERGSVHHQTSYRGSTSDYSAAIADFTEAIALEPDSADHRYRRGRSLLQAALDSRSTDPLTDAIGDFDAACERDPTNGRFHHYRGLALEQLGRKEEAHAAFITAVDLGHEESKSKLSFWHRLSRRFSR